MKRPHSFWIAGAALVVVSSFFIYAARAQNQDQCVSAGGTAECTGPEVGPYTYALYSPGWGSGTLVSEESAMALLESIHEDQQACTVSIHNPPWYPLPPASGWYDIGTDHYYVTRSSFGIEHDQRKWTVTVSGTYGTNSTPACGYNYSHTYQLLRGHAIACPLFFQGNMWTPGPNGNGYCWRTAAPWLEPRKNVGPPQQCDLSAGNPVNIATGNKYAEERDYVGAGAFPLEYVRRYNSQAAQHLYSAAAPPFVSRLPMWRGSYDKAVLFNGHSAFPAVDVYREDARIIRFEPVSGVWQTDADVNLKLTQHVDTGGVTTGWTVTTENDVREEYDAAGSLISQSNRAGVTHTVSYDAQGRIASVTHSFGYQIGFNYDVNDRLISISLPGSGTITYQYDFPRLSGVTYPDTRSRTYHYENSSWWNALTGITDESNTRFATYGYDSNGRANLSEHAGGADRHTFAYPSSTSTTVTDPLNESRTWTHGIVLDSARAMSVSSKSTSCPSAAKSKSYDANGNPSSTVDFNDIDTRRTYDLARNLETSRTEAYGTPRARTITTTWHSTFRLPTQIDEPGKRTTFTHDTNGNVLTKTVLDTATSESRTWTYTYNGFGQVLTANGPRTDVSDVTTYTYYSCTTGYQCGQVNTITNAAGHVTTYNTYNAHGQPLTITDPNGLVTTLTYDARQRLTSRTVGTEQTTFDYWPTGLVKKATLPDGSFLEYTYDGAHRLAEIEDAEGNRVVYTLDAAGNRTGENLYDPSNALTQTRTRVFNTLNQLWKVIGAAGTANVTTTHDYDNDGNQIGVYAPLGRYSAQAYDELNRLTAVADALSGTTQYGYNALDQLISVTDPRSNATTYTYNALGDLIQQVSPDTGTTTSTYDAAGNLQTSTDARGKTAGYSYDALNRVTGVTYADQSISYAYDGGTDQKGRLTQISDASGSTHWTYDSQGRALSRQQNMGVSKMLSYAYDISGRPETLTLPSGNTITYAYTNGQITGLTLNGSTTILSNVLYEPFGPTRGWTWGNSTLAIREHDADGRVTAIDSASLKTYAYDEASRIVGIADADTPALSAEYRYDAADRLLDEAAPDAVAVSISATTVASGATLQGIASNLPQMQGYWLALSSFGAPATTYYAWTAIPPSSGTYTWNVTVPSFAGTYEIRVFRGGFQHLVSASPPFTVTPPPAPSQPTLELNASRTLASKSITVRLAGGLGGSQDWLALAQVGAADTSYLQWTYVGGAVTNRDWTVTLPATEGSYEFRLFANNGYTRLATSSPIVLTDDPPVSGGGSPAGQYDLNGNRLAYDGSSYALSSTSNRVLSVSGAVNRTYSYDNAGNTTSDGETTFTYNDAGRMVSATKAGLTTTYVLNGLGQRVKKVTSGSSRYFVYDQAGHLVGEYGSSGNLIQETVWFADIPAATLRPNGAGASLFYIHTDHLNAPRRISRPSDNIVVWRWDSDAFGTTMASEDPDADSNLFVYNLRFPGQYFDGETALHYNYFRDYDPSVGRYVQSDPIGLNGGVNTFAYANANPVKFVDPAGLDPWVGGSAGGRVDILIGGYGARTGTLTNTKTSETCVVAYRCVNIGVGALGALGAEVTGSLMGPQCGRNLDGLGISLTFDAVAPGVPGISASIDLTGAGLGAGIGPTAGAGVFGGFSFCFARVISCFNTPCECQK